MRKVRALLAVNETVRKAILDNYKLVNPEDVSEGYVRNDFPTKEHWRAFKSAYVGSWPPVTLGASTYTPFEMRIPEVYVDKGDITSGLKYLEWLLTNYPNKFHVIGVWNREGSQFGTHYKQVENGFTFHENNDREVTWVDTEVIDMEATLAAGVLTYMTIQVEQVNYVPNGTFTSVPDYDTVQVGTPVYPIHPQFMKVMPPDVIYNPDGSVLSSTPATEPKEVHTPLGWGKCNWAI